MCVCESTLTFLCLMARASRSMLIIAQQVATLYSLFISANCCTCFDWYLHPSSGAHVTVPTASGISKTPPKYIERFTDINKLYIVASC